MSAGRSRRQIDVSKREVELRSSRRDERGPDSSQLFTSESDGMVGGEGRQSWYGTAFLIQERRR